MKDLLRLRTSLTEEMELALNQQIKLEAKASSLYLSMASWCDTHGFANAADFLYKQAEEERTHMLRLFRYVNNVGGKATSPEVSDIQQDFDSFRSIFDQLLEQEISNSHAINAVVDKCYKLKDYATLKFMQWYVEEQIEEEFIARRILELFDVIGTEGVGVYMIDKKIPEVKFEGEK